MRVEVDVMGSPSLMLIVPTSSARGHKATMNSWNSRVARTTRACTLPSNARISATPSNGHYPGRPLNDWGGGHARMTLLTDSSLQLHSPPHQGCPLVAAMRRYFNPFTAPACKISGFSERCADAPANSVFSGPVTHLLSMLCVLMKVL